MAQQRTGSTPEAGPARPAADRPKVFCIGLGKTGTTTFGALMAGLGYRHLVGPQKLGMALWKAGREDWLFELVDRRDSFDDFPYPFLYRALSQRYPDARFVLTLRHSPEEWLRSLASHNLRTGPTDTFLTAYGCYATEGHEERLLDLYRGHAEAVRAFFEGSPNFLELRWSDPDAGARFADFLGRPAPIAVPNANAAAGKDLSAAVAKFVRRERIGAALKLVDAHGVREEHREALEGALRRSVDGHLGALAGAQGQRPVGRLARVRRALSRALPAAR